MINILIFGGKGYVGSCLAKLLSSMDNFNKIIIIDKNKSKDKIINSNKIYYYNYNLFDVKKVYKIAKKHEINFVVDLTSQYKDESYENNPINYYEKHLLKIVAITKVLRYAHIKNFMIFDMLFFGKKINIDTLDYRYSNLKSIQENILDDVFRFHNINMHKINHSIIIGSYEDMKKLSRNNFISNSFDRILQNQDIDLSMYKNIYEQNINFIHVQDFCNGIQIQIQKAFLDNKPTNANIISDKFFSPYQIFKTIEKISGINILNNIEKKEIKFKIEIDSLKFKKEYSNSKTLIDEFNVRKILRLYE